MSTTIRFQAVSTHACDEATLVLGIGNTLLGDDGIGIHAVRALEKTGLRGARFLDGGTLSLVLLPDIANVQRWLVIDAAQLNACAGTVRVFEGQAMDAFLGASRRQSVHEVSLLDLVGAARLMNSLPRNRALIAVQPQTVDWCERPSVKVQAAIPEVCRLADALVHRWREHAGQEDAR